MLSRSWTSRLAASMPRDPQVLVFPGSKSGCFPTFTVSINVRKGFHFAATFGGALESSWACDGSCETSTTSNRFDKQDACCHLLHAKSCQGLPIEQASGLSGNHVANEEIAATIISVKEQFRGC